MLNTNLLSLAQKVIDRPSYVSFTVKAHFFNANSESTYSFYPLDINRIEMERNFVVNYNDVIDLTMTVSLKDYALLQDQGEDLLCLLTFSYVDKGGLPVFTPAPVQKQYHVTINDPRNIRQSIPDVQAYTDPSTQITVRLIEESSYKLRHGRVNTIFQNATVSDAIHGVTQLLGISGIELIAPDNTHRYDHIDIPSYQGIESVFLYLQSKFGVYEAGITGYFTGDILYVYPPFKTAPTYPRNALFYQVDQGRYTGVDAFHYTENDNISIVVNKPSESIDMSVLGSENTGTGFIFNRSSRMVDGYTDIGDDGKAKWTDEPGLAVNLQSSRMAVKNTNNIRHIRTTDNPYPAMSEILMHQASIMTVEWQRADPFQLDPGHAVSYYYDQNSTMVKKTGIIEKATYGINKVDKAGNKDTFACVAQLIVRLAPNESEILQ